MSGIWLIFVVVVLLILVGFVVLNDVLTYFDLQRRLKAEREKRMKPNEEGA